MIEFHASTAWRAAYWLVTVLQVLVVSLALAGGSTGAVISSTTFLVIFFVLALQSRSPIRMTTEGVADERLMLRKGWPWNDVSTVAVRRGNLLRPDLLIRHDSGRAMPLNLTGLRVMRDGDRLTREDAITAVTALARRGGADVLDSR